MSAESASHATNASPAAAPRPWTDRLGSVASALCAVHCAVVALAPAVLPMLGLGFLTGETTEWTLVAVAITMAGLGAWFGYRVHGSRSIALGFVVGVALLLASRLTESMGGGHELGLAFALAGGATLVTSHAVSLRRCRDCHREACAKAS